MDSYLSSCTERLLREGHEEIAQYSSPTTGKRKRETRDEASHERRVSSASHASKGSSKETKSKLKRVRSAADTAEERKSARRNSQEATFQPALSSDPRAAKDESDDAHKMKPPAKGPSEPSSTVMNTSSDERRAMELLQQPSASQASCKTPEHLKDEPSSKWTDDSKYCPSATPSNFERTPTDSNAPQDQPTEPMVVIAQSTNRESDGGSTSNAKSSKARLTFEHEVLPGVKFNTSDEVAIGLPTEQYKPRPSRSRSSRVVSTQESEPVTEVKPTKKSKATRSKSMPEPALADVEQLQEMGFQASQARSALLQKDGNVEEAADMLLERSTGNDKEAHVTRGTSKPRKRELVEQGSESSEDEITTAQASASRRVQTARIDKTKEELGANDRGEKNIPQATRTRGRPKKKSKGKDDDSKAETVAGPQIQVLDNMEDEEHEDGATKATIDQQLESDHGAEQSLHAQVDTAAPSTGKKKGRGRPKKNRSKDDGLVLDEAGARAQDATISDKARALKDIPPPNKGHTVGDDTYTNAISDRPDAREAHAAEALPNATASKENEAPATPSPQKPASYKQSGSPMKKGTPLSNGRVPHRVGLSKKTKIESLLKVKRG